MAAPSIPISFTESKAAFVKRALEVGLAQSEVDHLVASHIDTLSKLAFVLVPPGKVPEDAAVTSLLPSTSNQGSVAGLKRLLFEAHTLIVSELKQRVEKSEDSAPVSLNGAERETRLEAQKLRLGGLSFQGEEEVAHDAYNLVYAMIQKDDLVWLAPEKFGTRRSEISAKKQGKEVIIDGSGLAIKEKQTTTVCSLVTDLDLVMALRRRALAFDLIGVASFNTINKYHQALAQRMQEPPPPGYSRVSLQQLIRADRAVFLRAAELTTTLKRNSGGQLPLDNILSTILLDPSVAYHLLPLPVSGSSSAEPSKDGKRPGPDASASQRGAKHQKVGKKTGGPGAARKTSFAVPKELVGKLHQTPKGHRLCWSFNLPCGCADAKPGGKCARGLHLCAEPGCLKPHSLQQHS